MAGGIIVMACMRRAGAAALSFVLAAGAAGAEGFENPPPQDQGKPSYSWQQVLNLLRAGPGPLDQAAVERQLGIQMNRGAQSALDNYTAGFAVWQDGQPRISVALSYYPNQKGGVVVSHHSSLDIYLPRTICVTPEQLDRDFRQRGFEARGANELTAHKLRYSVGEHRWVQVTSPGGKPGDVRLRLPHPGGTSEPVFKRCVTSLLVDEDG